ncbi:MAG: long-chain fatty acid--CoA ligase, partial [Bacteroidales bacterium]|nr:long-chain fatty acid--CoA ligase [Bacteroidales bacterium]
QDRFIADLERRKADILEFVNSHVNRSSRIKEVEVEKKPFAKTATLKIKRFLYKDKSKPTDGTDSK